MLRNTRKTHTLCDQFFWLAQIVYKAAINLTKVCIILLYLRIFNKIRWFRWACWFLLGSVASYCLASVMATVFQCSPIERSFDKSIDGHCVNNSQFWYANAGFSIATDIIILLLPMPLVYQLQVPMPQKVALMAVFALGFFVVVTSCLRITTLDILATTPDTTYDITNVMWTIIEPNVAVVCACLPILRPLIVKLVPILRNRGYTTPYGVSGYYGKMSRTQGTQHTQASQIRGDNNDYNNDNNNGSHWVEIGGAGTPSNAAADDISMSPIPRNNSNAGSQDTILADTTRRGGGGVGDGGIQKTVEYSIQYSNKQ